MQGLKSFSVEAESGLIYGGATLMRREPERFIHILVPAHDVPRFLKLPVAPALEALA